MSTTNIFQTFHVSANRGFLVNLLPRTLRHLVNCLLSLAVCITLARWPTVSSYSHGGATNRHTTTASSSSNNNNNKAASCVYTGNINTDRNWFGYIANISVPASVTSSARVLFDFRFAADRCCPSLLFYSDDQMSVVSGRMNCWQKENLLRPEEDQILRLTPRFSWSGCQLLTDSAGTPAEYVCQGGRSFIVVNSDVMSSSQSDDYDQQMVPDHGKATPTLSWYLAVSNCDATRGLSMRYRITVHGALRNGCPTSSDGQPDDQVPSYRINDAGTSPPATAADDTSEESTCTISGLLNTTETWFGFIGNLSLGPRGWFSYRFVHHASPAAQPWPTVLFYLDHDAAVSVQTDRTLTCRQRTDAALGVTSRDIRNVVPIRPDGSGCSATGSDVIEVTCVGERRHVTNQRVVIGVSDCGGSEGPLVVQYSVEATGLTGDFMCNLQSTSTFQPTILLLCFLLSFFLSFQAIEYCAH